MSIQSLQDHTKNSICLPKPGLTASRSFTLLSGAVGIAAAGYGFSQMDKALQATNSVSTAAGLGAGFIGLGFGLLAWLFAVVAQWETSGIQEDRVQTLTKANKNLQQDVEDLQAKVDQTAKKGWLS